MGQSLTNSVQNQAEFTSLKEQTDTLLGQLQYVMQVQSPNFSLVKIYRFSQPPYEYYMQYNHQHVDGDTNLQKRIQHYGKIPKHKNVVQIEGIAFQTNKKMCIVLKVLQVYCKFYNFTINDIVTRKRKSGKYQLWNQRINQTANVSSFPQDSPNCTKNIDSAITSNNSNTWSPEQIFNRISTNPLDASRQNSQPEKAITKMTGFSQPDLWYVLSCLVGVGQAYSKAYKEQFGGFRIDKVFLSPDGYVKIYLFQEFEQIKLNILGCRTLEGNKMSEELSFIQNDEMKERISLHSSNHSHKGIKHLGSRGSSQKKISRQTIFQFEHSSQINMEFHARSKPKRPSNSRISQSGVHNSETESSNGEYLLGYRHPQKNDIFDIGLVILSMITLDGISSYYDMHNRPKLQFIQFMVNSLHRRGISLQLQSLLKGMLQSIDKRISYTQIKEQMQKYKSDQPSNRQARVSYCIKFEQEPIKDQIQDNQNVKKSQLRKLVRSDHLVPGKVQLCSNSRPSIKKASSDLPQIQ